MAQPEHHMRTTRFETLVMHRPVAWLAAHGITLNGKAVLTVRGRTSGEPRSVPVNPLPHGGERYLVSPRGTTAWVRNLRAAGEGRLRRGRTVERFTAVELADEEKGEVLRAYLERWGWEVGKFFGGVSAKSTDEALRGEAPRHPVFRVTVHPGR